MQSFLSYIKENYGMPLFQQEVQEKPELLLEGDDAKWQVRQFFNEPWSKPFSAEYLMDLLKHRKITVDWYVKKVNRSDMDQSKIRLHKELVGIFHQIKNARNTHFATVS